MTAETEEEEVTYNSTNVLFMIFSTFAIFWMVQGAGLFYSGLTRRKNALIQSAYSMLALSIVSIQWFLIGYSLVFSESTGPFIGGFRRVGLRHALGEKNLSQINNVPEVANALFGSMFPSVTAALTIGAVADRGRVLPATVFIFIWTTIVYDPIAFWTWNEAGWARRMGSLDYAGGTIVHITSGFSALAYSLILGKRLGHGTEQLNYRPHNAVLVVVGTALLWAGWFGFNAGSAFAPHTQSVIAILNTQLSASAGGLAWAYMDYRLDSHWSIVGFCSGIVSGLVCITSGAGYMSPWAALFIGFVGGCVCNLSTKIKFYLDIDDALDVFAVHGIGGLIGTIFTGIFATNSIAKDIKGGLIQGNISPVIHQLVVGLATSTYAFIMSIIVLLVIKEVPNLHLRVRRDQELAGLDISEHDELVFDHTELVTDIESILLGYDESAYATGGQEQSAQAHHRNGISSIGNIGNGGVTIGNGVVGSGVNGAGGGGVVGSAGLSSGSGNTTVYKSISTPNIEQDEDPFHGTGMFPGISPRSPRGSEAHLADNSPLLGHT